MTPPQLADGEGQDLQAILRDLNRAKVAFQLRTISLVLGCDEVQPIEAPFHAEGVAHD